MDFDPAAYGPQVAEILALDGAGWRMMPLAIEGAPSEALVDRLRPLLKEHLFKSARAPEAALSGLWVYFSCFEEGHNLAQDIPTSEGSYWHGILHRQEPDAGNAGYWFRQVGRHPVFSPLAHAARRIAAEGQGNFPPGEDWNPFRFIDFCEEARQRPGSEQEMVARRIQLAEWQLLFDYCARPAS